MKAIVKKIGARPEVVDVEITLEWLQGVVGGWIEEVQIGPSVAVVCNEDGIQMGLPHNTASLLGDIVIIAHDREGYPRSLTAEEERKGLAYLERFKDVKHPTLTGENIQPQIFTIDEILRANARQVHAVWDSL